MKKTGQLGVEQLMQLAWWQEQADLWSVYFSVEGTDLVVRCRECDRGIMSVAGYIVKLSELTAQTVAHLRQFHRELGANGREDAKMASRDDVARGDSSSANSASRLQAKE